MSEEKPAAKKPEEAPAPGVFDKIRTKLITILGVALSLFTLC